MEHKNWNGFKTGKWQDEINVRDFIQTNYNEYTGNDEFLETATDRTNELMKKVQALFALERQFGGVLDIDTATVSSLTSFSPGYIDKDYRRYADQPTAQTQRKPLWRYAYGSSGV